MIEMLKQMKAEAERAIIYAEAKLEVVERLISEVEKPVEVAEVSTEELSEETETEENPFDNI